MERKHKSQFLLKNCVGLGQKLSCKKYSKDLLQRYVMYKFTKDQEEGWRDSIVGRELALHETLIPSIAL